MQMSEVIKLEDRRQTVRLGELESAIETGVRHFLGVGKALIEIRDAKLYSAAGYSTFEAYCKTRWSFTRQRAYQLMEAATVTENVNRCLQDVPLPSNEAQTRELARLPAADQPSAWAEAAADAPNGKVSAPIVRSVVSKRLRETKVAAGAEAEAQSANPEDVPHAHSYRNKETEERDKQIGALLSEGYAPHEIVQRIGCKSIQVHDAKVRLGLTGKRKNPVRGLLSQAVEFTDAWDDAKRSSGTWEKATPSEIAEVVAQLETLAQATKALIGALKTHVNRRKKHVGKNEKASS
jgi:hypothetical protein